jgi:hypothetical protein
MSRESNPGSAGVGRPTDPHHGGRIAALVVAVTLIAGCSAARPSIDGSPSSVPSPIASAATSSVPTTTASLEPSPEPASPSPSEEPVDAPTPGATLEPPPDATLQVEGGDAVIGELGSWGWKSAASDAPYLPGAPMHVGTGERLTFRMTTPVPIESWQIRRLPPSSVPDGVDGLVGMGEGTGEAISFAAPRKGTWSVSVSVQFADTLGSAAYYWKVTVE